MGIVGCSIYDATFRVITDAQSTKLTKKRRTSLFFFFTIFLL